MFPTSDTRWTNVETEFEIEDFETCTLPTNSVR